MSDEKLIELLRQALPFLEGYDLMGTGGFVPKKVYEELNTLEKEIAIVLDEDPDDCGNHTKVG